MFYQKTRRLFSSFDPFVDYYKILGVSKSASSKQIRTGYYNMAKKFHPDLNTETKGADFEKLNL